MSHCDNIVAGVQGQTVARLVDAAVQELCERFFKGMFDYAVGDHEGVQKKPAPDMVLKAMEELGVTKDEAVYVGDSDVDIKTAENCGLPCISVTWGFRNTEFLLEHGATHLVNTPAEILKLVSE